ncbi:hypothetical protein [Allorhodopirellula heiligendammensis]|uniref:Uncharacterized protein n=1 Tax=Allorhodopirellula heiligendammensis TaxID=2714739 RepID=A0A5C6BGU7_9BACT|nr:hypothetical protein [Allorhodopirellula heiligendammensis]TWU10516.1 hypothetical protein Poly21_44210 [Allorhodopirellula heiligendammensis]
MKKNNHDYIFSATELSNFLACRHATSLDMRRANGEIEVPFGHNARLDRLAENGLAHEAAYLAMLHRQGLNIVELRDFNDATQVETTADLMRQGVDVIFQGSLSKDHGKRTL